MTTTMQQRERHDATTTAGPSATDGERQRRSAGVVVTIQDFTFDARAGDGRRPSFEVENKDSTDHTFTADDGAFDVEVPAGETVTVDALDRRAPYAFHCNDPLA